MQALFLSTLARRASVRFLSQPAHGRGPATPMRAALVALGTCISVSSPCWAAAPDPRPATEVVDSASLPQNSVMGAEQFYGVLLGELYAHTGDPGNGYSVMLELARKYDSAQLYQEAVTIALQNGAAEPALQAARAWKNAQPRSVLANRYLLGLLISTQKLEESVAPLKAEIANAGPAERPSVIAGIPSDYRRATNKKLAATVVERALTDSLKEQTTAAPAWTTIGLMRLDAGDSVGAWIAAQSGHTADPKADGPALLSIALIDPARPQAEALVRDYLAGPVRPQVHMAYVQALLNAERYPEALAQLQALTQAHPDFAPAWLSLGLMQSQDNQLSAATVSLQRYLTLSDAQSTSERGTGPAQAYLGLSRIAQKQNKDQEAAQWLDKIPNSADLLQVQSQRAALLANQGHLDQARKLLQEFPARDPADERAKLQAEVQLLRDNDHNQQAYELLAQASARDPSDTDLLYDQAMVADKLEHWDDMERLLRQLIALKPNAQNAYNALGYSLADRNLRLPEAKELIQKALAITPDDPFIQDSLAWVEYRMGHTEEALRLLSAAFKAKPDPEIAAHLGEVLWVSQQHSQAQEVWKKGLALDPTNASLLSTLKRLHAQP